MVALICLSSNISWLVDGSYFMANFPHSSMTELWSECLGDSIFLEKISHGSASDLLM